MPVRTEKEELVYLYSLLHTVDDHLQARDDAYHDAVADTAPINLYATTKTFRTAVLDGYDDVAAFLSEEYGIDRDRYDRADAIQGGDAATDGGQRADPEAVGATFARWDDRFARSRSYPRDPASYNGAVATGDDDYPGQLPDTPHAREVFDHLENRLGPEAVYDQLDDVLELVDNLDS